MSAGRVAVTVCLFVLVGTIPGATVGAQEATLFPRQKPPTSELFKVPPPKPAVNAPQIAMLEAQSAIQGLVQEFPMPRTVCGMKVIEGNPDVDPRIVIPIPERHNAKIRVVGPPPCESVTVWGAEGRVITGSVLVDLGRR
jgi:hypothetical protein